MRCWAQASRAAQIQSCFFVALEDVAALRWTSPERYRAFVAAVRDLSDAGCDFYPHNHGVFDPETGAVPERSAGRPQHIAGYRKRASFFFDVVRLNGLDLAEWLTILTSEYERFLADAGLARPKRRVFRPGGWDNGSTAEELSAYVWSLRDVGYDYDSSATSGDFGTASWRVGTAFAENVFRLDGNLVEVAPTSFANCAAPILSRETLSSLLRMAPQTRLIRRSASGVSVLVLHFDHLLAHRAATYDRFSLPSATLVERRIQSVFRRLAFVHCVLRLTSATFDGLGL